MPEPRSDRRTVLVHGVGVILLASVLFGIMAVCVRAAARELPAAQIAGVRFLGSLAVLLAVTRGSGLRPQPGNLRRVLLRGLLGACAIILYFHGIEGAGAGVATVLNCTYPLFTAVFASVLIGERIRRPLVGALALNAVGVAAVLGPGAGLGQHALIGCASALGGAVFAGAAVATARELRASEEALLITTYFMAVGTVLTAPALLRPWPACTTSLLAALLAVVLTSVTGQVLLHQGLGFAPATEGSLAAATSVVTAAALEAVVLGEHLNVHSLIGAACVIAALGLAVRQTALPAADVALPGPLRDDRAQRFQGGRHARVARRSLPH